MEEQMLLRDFRSYNLGDLEEEDEAIKALSLFSQPPRCPFIKERTSRSRSENQKH